jgi:hypothetical protein
MKQTFDDIQAQFRGNRKITKSTDTITFDPLTKEVAVEAMNSSRAQALARLKRCNEFSKMVDKWID